jgi:(2S)-methylsuccinyl-CoA dehydrogenase
VPPAGLLGGVEGQGFKQLMRPSRGARIQTAARAVGVARARWSWACATRLDRKQFGGPIVGFPAGGRQAGDDGCEIMAREADLFRRAPEGRGQALRHRGRHGQAARRPGRLEQRRQRLQIHGGNGYALEYEISRVLCDARILNIFEGAAEIQAQVIGKEAGWELGAFAADGRQVMGASAS